MRWRNRSAFVVPLLFVLAVAGPTEGSSPARQALDRGAELYRQQRYEEAISAFRQATRLDPGLLLAWENLARACQRAGRNVEAIALWQTVLKVEPKRVDLLNTLGALQLSEGLAPEAAETLSRSLAIDPTQTANRLRLAVAWERAGRIPEAEKEYRRMAEPHPHDLEATIRLAEFYGRSGREEEALGLLRDAQSRLPGAATSMRPDIARLHARLGDRAYAERDYDDALTAYTEAVRLDPATVQHRVNLGWAHRRLGDLQEATAIWTEVLANEPARRDLLRHIGDVELERGHLDEAAALYARAWGEQERTPSLAYRLADIALRQGRIEDASSWLERMLALEGEGDDWYARAASLFAQRDRIEDGVAFFHRGLESASRSAETRKALSRLHVARAGAFYEAADYAAAASALEEALVLDPVSLRALRDLGWVHRAAGDWTACTAAWTRYAAAHPDLSEPHNLLTHLHLERGDSAAAIASARASLGLDPDQPEQRLKLARALFRDGQFARARDLAEALALERRDDSAAQLFWAELLMQYHEFDRGQEQWRRVLDLDLDSPKAPYFWVLSLYEQGHYDDAVGEARRLLEERGPNHLLLRFLARDALLRGREDEAIRWYEQMTRSFPERTHGWLELARLQGETGDLEASAHSLEAAIRHHPEDLDLAVARAQVDRRRGRADEAYAAFRSLGAQYPDHREIFWGRVETAIEAGRPAEASSVLRARRTGSLEDYEARMLEARVLFATGHREEAETALAPIVNPPGETVYVPTLLYHGLGEHPRTSAMPVGRFDSQMRALSRKGYTALTVRELRSMLDREMPLPAKPILITFDDARLDSFRLGDPVLERYGLKATMFVPTGRILDDHPFFADWKTIASYAGSGRWDLQSHGHHAHDLIVVSGTGEKGSFLVNRQWLGEEGRLETEDEYLARLEADHRESRSEIERHVSASEVVGYAFPMSEAGQESAGNEPRARERNREVLARHFRFGLVQDHRGFTALRPSEPTLFIRRLAVPRSWGGSELVHHLARARPSARALAQRGRMRYWAGQYASARGDWERLQATYPPLRGEATYYLAAISHQQGWHRTAEQQLRAARRLDSDLLRGNPSLSHRISWENRSRLQPRIDFTGDSAGRETLAQGLDLRLAFLGPLELTFGGARVALRETGFGSLEGRELGAGAGLRGAGPWTLEGRAWQSRMDGAAPSTLNYRGRAGFEGQQAALVVRGGREDVATLRARRRGVQADTLGLSSSFRLGSRVSVSGNAAYARLSDGNERRDVVGRLSLEPGWATGLGLGAAVGWSDTGFQTPIYYTPEELRWARGILAYRKRWATGWRFEAEAGLGLASDLLRGRRLTSQLSGRAEQVWGDRVHTLLEGRYSSSPGYRGWGFGGAMQLGF